MHAELETIRPGVAVHRATFKSRTINLPQQSAAGNLIVDIWDERKKDHSRAREICGGRFFYNL